MPRISRFVIEFDVGEKTWQAETSHQHALEEGSGANRHIKEPLTHRVECGPDMGKFIKVQHVTTIRLRHKGSAIFLRGVSPCSLRDRYRWKFGIHMALQRALEKAGYCKLDKATECPHILADGRRRHDTAQRAGICPDIGKVIVSDKKPIYDEICDAFWREMRIRLPDPRPKPSEAVQQPIPASIGRSPAAVDANEYTGKLHGLGWVGD